MSSVTPTDTVFKDHSSEIYRGKWVRKIDFLFACIGFSVGLGNMWRFPYLCYKNGGGAFLIPYLISVVIGGIPCFFLEVITGQFMARGGIEVWNICPIFKGIGYASAFIVFCLNTYYCIIICWAFYYLFSSFQWDLPWASCKNWWNTNKCSTNSRYSNATDPVVEFWERNVLELSSGIDEPGSIQWKLFFCLLFSWCLVYFCIWKGIKAAGKILYITALSPYVLMFILLIRTSMLKGAANGLYYFIIPEWSKMKSKDVWVDAGTQTFFSYSISLGTLSALGSFNSYHYNSFRDALIFALINTFTSMLAGLIIFNTLGFMSLQTGLSISEVVQGGPGLAFVVYPKALAQMPGSTLWSIVFFLTIIFLGCDSQFVGVEGFVTAVSDIFPRFMSKANNSELFTLGVCCVNLIIGISMITKGGLYVFLIFDHYGGARSVVLIAVFECVAITYCVGINRFSIYLKDMLGFSLWYLPHILWGFVSPVYLLSIFIMSMSVYKELEYTTTSKNESYVYPGWAIAIGWSMALFSVIIIPTVSIVELLLAKGGCKERLVKLSRPRFES